jgi:diguanylate cyclase (GGDEF)-like protein
VRTPNKPVSTLSIKTPIATLLAVVVIMAGLTWFSLWQTAREANAVDLERTRQAVGTAMVEQGKRLGAIAGDNAQWDDAAFAVYAPVIDQDFIDRTWRTSTDITGLLDTIAIIGADYSVKASFESGKVTNRDYVKTYGKSFQTLIDKAAAGEQAVTGIIKADDGIRFIAVEKIRAIEEENAHVGEGMMPILYVASRRLESTVLNDISNQLVLKGLRFSEEQTANSAAIVDPSKRIIGWMHWTPNQPGDKAIARSWPIMTGGVLLCLFVVGALARFGFRAITEINRSAFVDSLSQLPNRRSLKAGLRTAVKNGEMLALAFIDLDGFKDVNDNFGHAVGDQLIQKCAETGQRAAKDCAMVARLGGDEFAIFASGADAPERLERAVDIFLARLTQPFRIGDRSIIVGASVGLAVETGDDVDGSATELMRKADIAMYASKRTGKMRKTWFSDGLDQMRAQTLEMENKLRAALDSNAFQVHYQPLVDAKNGKMIAVEALLRWNHPDDGEISPVQFVPVAEETGLINLIGLFVLRRACSDALRWPDTNLSVNVSTAQLRNPDFPEQLRQVLAETGFPAARLELEITETYVILDPQTARDVLDQIRALGVRIALDDFGTGYASIGFLRQFCFDKLKLDRSLVADAISDDPARAMLLASLTVARALKMSVTAEGIENAGQADFMRAIGCDHLQGWHFAAAVEASAIDWLVAEQAGDTRQRA